MDFDALSKRCKKFEKMYTRERFMPGLPIIARMDGRAFHTFTRGLRKPFDEQLVECMKRTTKEMVERFNAQIGYTQSDEITLAWITDLEDQILFGGKIFKFNSLLASTCSVVFFRNLLELLPEKAENVPVFDCRTWQTPNAYEAALAFYWRERDATRNSINTLAQSLYSHKQLQGKGVPEVHDLLHAKGVNWNDLEDGLKRGWYYHRVQIEEVLDLSDRMDIPEEHRVAKPVVRRKVVRKELPILRLEDNIVQALFDQEAQEEV